MLSTSDASIKIEKLVVVVKVVMLIGDESRRRRSSEIAEGFRRRTAVLVRNVVVEFGSTGSFNACDQETRVCGEDDMTAN